MRTPSPPEHRRAVLLSKPNPNYYAIIPANVRYDAELVPNAKLLYGEITALANATGECWANNKYFAELYGVAPTRISAWISSLVEKGYITVVVDQVAGNKRSIRLPLPEKENRSSGKVEDPSSGKVEDNNTSINNKTNTDVQKVYEYYLKRFTIPLRLKDQSHLKADQLLELAKKKYRLTPGRRDAIKRRIADAGPKMICEAILGFSRSPWHMGENDNGWTADLEEFICHKYENIEKGVGLYEKQNNNPDDPYKNL